MQGPENFKNQVNIPIVANEYYSATTLDVQVEVVPSFIVDKSIPFKNQYFFTYSIRITNHSETTLKLLQRHFKIKEGNGKSYDVQGPGVVGENPVLPPRTAFEYTSSCTLNSPSGNMRGKYQLCDEFKNTFWVEVPVFFFRLPQTFIQ